MNPMKRICIIMLTLSLSLVFPSAAFAQGNASLWTDCVYTCSNETRDGLRKIMDDDPGTHLTIAGPGSVTVSWEPDVPASKLYIEWYSIPEWFTVTQYDINGNILSVLFGETILINQLYALQNGSSSVCIRSDADMDIGTLQIYDADTIPNFYHEWGESPEKLDYLVISAHPDDDVLFMGAIIPIYGAERGLTGNILYVCSKDLRLRCNEALNAAWAMGLRCYPVFAGFMDIANTKKNVWGQDFTLDAITRYLVGQLRKYKPEIVVTHDPNGEYGHWQHILISEAAQQAVVLAADATYDPVTASEYGVYQVKKLYLHLYPENTVVLDVEAPLQAFGGQSASEVAKFAFEEHRSQIENGYHRVRNEGVYSLSDFGLYYSTVGPDSGTNDMFENIKKELLSTYVAPEPTPTPTQPCASTAQPVTDANETAKTLIPSSIWALYLSAGILIGVSGIILAAVAIRRKMNYTREQADTTGDE